MRRGVRNFHEAGALLLFYSSFALLRVAVANLYFTNTNDIRSFSSQDNDTILYNDSYHPQALDFNSCAGSPKIYWISLLDGRIHRGNSTGGGEVENVVTDDIVQPKGIAVDYIGGNVYFSQQTAVKERGRIEVVKCDGHYRKVLITGLSEAGPLALDMTRGYLYYVNGRSIYRADTNGRNKKLLATVTDSVTGLAMDTSRNLLYWSVNGTIQFLNVSDPDSMPPPQPQPVATGTNHFPVGISAGDGVLYWTELGNNLTIPGAIYKLAVAGGNPEEEEDEGEEPNLIHSSMEIHPRDISTSPSVATPNQGCATPSNGDCDQFCFTIPDPSNSGLTTHECSCNTGVVYQDPDPDQGTPGVCPKFPDKFILYGRQVDSSLSRIAMVSLDTDVGISVQLPYQIPGLGASFLAYDIKSNYIYWDQSDPPAIMRGKINSDVVEEVITTDIRYVSGLAIDPYHQHLYWSDSALDRIEVLSLSLTTDDRGVVNRKVLVEGDIHRPQSLALDLNNGYMYWADVDVSQLRIERARIDGSDRQVVFSGLDVLPSYITVDPDSGRVYWTNTQNDGKINSNQSLSSSAGDGYFVRAYSVQGLTILDGNIYWTNAVDSSIGIATVNNGVVSRHEPHELVDNVQGVRGVVAVDTNRIPAPKCTNADGSECSHLCFYVDGTPHCACPDLLDLMENDITKCNETLGYSVLANQGQMMGQPMFTLELHNREFHADGEKWLPSYRIELEAIVSMAIHVFNNTHSDVYYARASDMLIYRRRVAKKPEYAIGDAVPVITCCLATVGDLAVDWLGQNLYWTDMERGVIEVSLLSGEARRILYSDLNRPSLLTLDPSRGVLFYTEGDGRTIYSLAMNGTSLSHEAFCNHGNIGCDLDYQPNTGHIISISIDFDSARGFHDFLVWSYQSRNETVTVGYYLDEVTTATSTIKLINSIENIESTNEHLTQTLAFNSSFYYSRHLDSISRVEEGGNDIVVDTFPNLVEFLEFSIAQRRLQPGYHECAAGEVCTGRNPMCLVTDHIYGSCHCPLDSFLAIHKEGQFNLNVTSCTKARSFLIWATKKDIYVYPLPSNLTNRDMTTKPHILPRGNHGEVAAVTYDPWSESVVWLEKGTNLLHRVTLDSSESKILGRIPNRVSLRSMTLDWIGGQVMFTEAEGYQIEAAAIREREEEKEEDLNVGSIVSSYLVENGVVSPEQPRDVIYDENNRAIIWQEGGKQILKTTIGSSRNTLSPLLPADSSRVISNMTFDPANNFVYWWNEKAKTIEGFDVDAETGQEGAGEVVTFVRGVDSIEGLSATTVTGDAKSHLLFWFEENKLFYCNVSDKLDQGEEFDCRREQLLLGNSEEIVAMTSFNQLHFESILATYQCRKGTRQCDYLCLEQTGNAVCACPLFKSPNNSDASECSEIECNQFHNSCNDDLECYPISYACDGLAHCTNGFDENNCSKCPKDSLSCGPGDSGCYSNASRCDAIPDCATGADELICCNEDTQFGCYATWDGRYRCFENQLRCEDNSNLCINYTKPDDCPTPTTQTLTPTEEESSKTTLIVATIAGVILGIMLFLITIIVCSVFISRVLTRMKNRRRQSIYFPSNSKAGSSPPPRSDNSSILSDMCSLGTESTNFNCVSPHQDPFDKTAVFHSERSMHLSNPPPSLITRRQSQLLEGEELSQADPCPPPCPSVDWEVMSGLSYSASQGGMRLNPTINGGGPSGGGADNLYHYHRPPVGYRGHHHHHHHGNSHQVAHAANPLHYHHVVNHGGFRGNGHAAYHHSNGNPYTSGAGQNSAATSVTSHNYCRAAPGGHYPSSVAMTRLRNRGGVPYSSDLPNYEEAETETVFSQSTIQTDNGSNFPFDDRTPPGRPPSPATITEFSEREFQQRCPPLSPTSEYTEEDEDEEEGEEGGEGEGGGGGEGLNTTTASHNSVQIHEHQV